MTTIEYPKQGEKVSFQKFIIKTRKLILSSLEDKRYYVNNLESVGYGHYRIKERNRPGRKRDREEEESNQNLGKHLIQHTKKNMCLFKIVATAMHRK